jgi:hypothetical protein
MKIEYDDLKKLYLGYIDSKVPGNRNKCPSPMALFNSFKSSTSHRNKKRNVDHISACSYCREEFELLLELQRYHTSSITLISGPSSAASPTYKRETANIGRPIIWKYAYFLFGLALSISAFYQFVQKNNLTEVKRASEPGILLIAPTHVHTFPKPLIFRWQEQSCSQYYILELFDNSLLPVWTSQKIRDVQIQLPAEVMSRLHSGNYYFWMITTFFDTQKISESELMRFLVLNK